MKNALQNLESFYEQCDRAEAPPLQGKPYKLISRAGSVMVGGLAPFFVAFSLAAVLMSMAGAMSPPEPPDSPIAFPKMLQSAGLSKADLRAPAAKNESLNLSATWRA